ncbi:putative nuclease HARBI1 isoform X2 [Tanacetum coccineum]
MCDDGIEQLLAQANEFLIEELNDDTYEKLLLMLEEKELRDEAFRRRFRMNKVLFMRIVDALSDHYEYFKQRNDALGIRGLSPIQKFTAAIRQLAYGTPAEVMTILRISEVLPLNAKRTFVRYVSAVLIACHWLGKMSSSLGKVIHTRGIRCLKKFCQVVIEIFGHVYLRRPSVEDVERILHLHSEHHGFPADGIYPEWATIVKSFPCPQDPQRKKFKEMQEAARKYMEREFGVLQSRWAIIRGAARFWHPKTMNDIIYFTEELECATQGMYRSRKNDSYVIEYGRLA